MRGVNVSALRRVIQEGPTVGQIADMKAHARALQRFGGRMPPGGEDVSILRRRLSSMGISDPKSALPIVREFLAAG